MTDPTDKEPKNKGGRPALGRVNVHTTIDPDIYERFERYCIKQGLRRNEVFDAALDAHLPL